MKPVWLQTNYDLFRRLHKSHQPRNEMVRFLDLIGVGTNFNIYVPPMAEQPYPGHKLIGYYYVSGIGNYETAGTLECQRVWTDRVGWDDDMVAYRFVNERYNPEYASLPVSALSALAIPAPDNMAARWRWRCWRHHGLQPIPYLGMGVTYDNGRDRVPFQVIDLYKGLVGLEIQPVEFRIVSGGMYSEQQEYEFGGVVGNQSWYIKPSKRKADRGKGYWRFQGGEGTYIVGYMDAWRDPSF